MFFSKFALLALAAFVAAAPAPDADIEDSVELVADGSFKGDGTYYAPGLGACGKTNSAKDHIVAIGHKYFDKFTPHGNPNHNSLCGRFITIHWKGKSIRAQIEDDCAGCAGEFDVDMSPAVFTKLSSEGVGRLHGITWNFS